MAPILPVDCFEEIFRFLQEDKTSLHSCILVNRLWCENTAPFLWRQPFTFLGTTLRASEKLIQTYLSCLNEKDRSLLITNGIKLPKLLRRSTFNYVTFLRNFHLERLQKSISKWMKSNQQKIDQVSQDIILYVLLRFITKYCPSLESVYIVLKSQPIKPISGDSIHIHFDDWADKFTSIRKLSIDFTDEPFDYNEDNEIHNIARLIRSQSILQHIKLIGKYQVCPEFIISSLGDTLTEAEFYNLNFEEDTSNLLECCKNLEVLIFDGCYFPMITTKQPLSSASLSRIRKLHIIETDFHFNDDVLLKLIRNTNSNLQELYITRHVYRDNIESLPRINSALVKYCPNIISLNMPFYTNELIYLSTFIKAFPKLRSLSIGSRWFDESPINYRSFEFGRILPTTLQCLEINMPCSFTAELFEMFLALLKSPLEILRIPYCQCISDQHLDVITRYLGNSLKELDIQWAGCVTREGYLKAQSYIKFIYIKNSEEIV
ncbi:14007_t:CDS:1 [Funneliformis mosseae]|uniref:14007_t:CDS:1 n=1 Tax=Funneliformis mosseae TaxID=27381 RepID=A0A9N8Z684_FUNMO|nr:14007_t:CDS:1 [Funneliformis mosseae]